jgi:hypothetical protein
MHGPRAHARRTEASISSRVRLSEAKSHLDRTFHVSVGTGAGLVAEELHVLGDRQERPVGGSQQRVVQVHICQGGLYATCCPHVRITST